MQMLGNSWAVTALRKLSKFQMAESHGERFLQLANEARSRIVEIAPRDAAESQKERAVIIDVREREEFQRGHIPGAINLPKGTIELEIEKRAPDPDVEIITYCGGGNRSAIVAENLQRMGYTRIKSVEGGFRAWLEAGLPVVRKSLLIED
jgi:phage shock protein E